MASTTFTVRVENAVKDRLEKLAESTGRSRSFLAAEAIREYLNVNEWQVAGIKRAMTSLDQGNGIPHQEVKDLAASWNAELETDSPGHRVRKRSAK